jgi:drug/metabolite transporter (DMT)-like permease
MLGALLLYNYGLRGTNPAAAAAMMNLMPIAGVVLSALILKETITIRHLLGTAVIIAGVFLSEYANKTV